MNTDREDLRLLITEFNDGPMGSADNFAWRRHLKTYEDLLAEVERLEGLLAKAGLCDECGLDNLGYADHEDACKCNESDE